uniref:Nodule Cysteine-Rich (NCR) secreted peptide n=1 Tax=Helianthus annuus TaxID=4232 RepID=A0A251TI03_HELAN
MAMSTYSVLFLIVIVIAVGHSYEDECEALIDTHECNLEVCGKKNVPKFIKEKQHTNILIF